MKWSNYDTSYDDPSKYQLTPWQFWTDEEKSWVIRQAYERQYLKTNEIKPFLTSIRHNFYSQLLLPITIAISYKYKLNTTIFNHFYRQSTLRGHTVSLLFLGVASWFWLNFSPLYIQNQINKHKMLDKLYKKIGLGIKSLNTVLPRSRTAMSIDKENLILHNRKNGPGTGYIHAQEDTAPPFLGEYRCHRNFLKKNYR